MKHPKGYWKNKENMMREARKYSTKEEFQKGNLYALLLDGKTKTAQKWLLDL